MVIELTAARILAPYVGISVYTWTSIIGIILLGISLGNFIGGWLIDKYKSVKTVFFVYIAAAAGTLAILPLSSLSYILARSELPLPAIIVSLSLGIFMVPALFLGALYPSFVKLSSPDNDAIGKYSGRISALWSMGSIAGTFAAGFYLAGFMGSSNTIILSSAVLFCNALCLYRPKKIAIAAAVFFFVATVLYAAEAGDTSRHIKNNLFGKESNYYSINVVSPDKGIFRGEKILLLDFDIHGVSGNITDKVGLYTGIYPVFSILNGNIKDIAVIGGGSYELSKKFADFYKEADVFTVEIDPEIEDVGKKFFNLSGYNIKNIVSDGRVFLAKTDRKYDLIFSDAYNSFVSVPWHMTTDEFNRVVKNRLSPEGIYAVNFISAVEGENSLFFQSMVKTFSAAFNNYYIFTLGNYPTEPQNIILIGINGGNKISREEFGRKVSMLPRKEYLAGKLMMKDPQIGDGAVFLTDDFAPTDKLMKPLIKKYFHKFAEFYYHEFFGASQNFMIIRLPHPCLSTLFRPA